MGTRGATHPGALRASTPSKQRVTQLHFLLDNGKAHPRLLFSFVTFFDQINISSYPNFLVCSMIYFLLSSFKSVFQSHALEGEGLPAL